MMDNKIKEAKKAVKYWKLELSKLIVEREKYIELGRLAITTKRGICGIESFEEYGCGNESCENSQFCQKRAELLGECQR